MSDKTYELDVYSNEQWQGPDRKGNYIVCGRIQHLREYVERWNAKDRARDPEGLTIYHVFYILVLDDRAAMEQAELDGDLEELIELDRLLHPSDYARCHHGLSLNLCEDPINHYDPRY
jgi:hypothetical protein